MTLKIEMARFEKTIKMNELFLPAGLASEVLLSKIDKKFEYPVYLIDKF